MTKPFNNLGDTWLEITINCIIFLFTIPFLLIGITLYFLGLLVHTVLGHPSPKKYEVLGNTSEQEPAKIAMAYIQEAKRLLPDVVVTKGSNKDYDFYTLQSSSHPSRTAEVYYDNHMVGFTIPAVDTGSWHSAEEDCIDEFFLWVIASLRSGVHFKKNRLGKRKAWIYSKELGVWLVTGADSDDTWHSMSYRRKNT